MSKIYEFNVESLVRQQNRVLVEADSEEEAVKKVRSGDWRFLYKDYTEDKDYVSDHITIQIRTRTLSIGWVKS